MMQIRITNMTANVSLQCSVDTDKLVKQKICKPFGKSKSNKNFNGVIYKSVATAQIYKNGKINIMGAKSRKAVEQVYDEICDKLMVEKAGPLNYTNFCATMDYGGKLPGDQLCEYLKRQPETKRVLLEPELFPPIKWEPKCLPSTVNIFRSGKINSTGNKTELQAVKSLALVAKLINKVSDVLTSPTKNR